MGDGRRFRAPGLPIEHEGAPVTAPADVPGIGDDTEAVLREAGCDAALIRAVTGEGR